MALGSTLLGLAFLLMVAGGLFSGWPGAQWQRFGPETFFLVGAGFAFVAAAAFRLRPG